MQVCNAMSVFISREIQLIQPLSGGWPHAVQTSREDIKYQCEVPVSTPASTTSVSCDKFSTAPVSCIPVPCAAISLLDASTHANIDENRSHTGSVKADDAKNVKLCILTREKQIQSLRFENEQLKNKKLKLQNKNLELSKKKLEIEIVYLQRKSTLWTLQIIFIVQTLLKIPNV